MIFENCESYLFLQINSSDIYYRVLNILYYIYFLINKNEIEWFWYESPFINLLNLSYFQKISEFLLKPVSLICR